MKMYLATILGSIGVLNLVVSYYFGVAGLTYGLVDQGVLMLGAYLGWELDPWIESRFKGARPGLGILVGALVGNTISDCAGAILDPDMRVMVFGITNGCLIPLLFVPLIEKMKAWRESEARDEAIDHWGIKWCGLYGSWSLVPMEGHGLEINTGVSCEHGRKLVEKLATELNTGEDVDFLEDLMGPLSKHQEKLADMLIDEKAGQPWSLIQLLIEAGAV